MKLNDHGMPIADVVIRDGPPPQVNCRDLREVNACEQLLQIMRRHHEPILFVVRRPDGDIEVHARGGAFPTLKRAEKVMTEAKVKLIDSLMKKHVPAFDAGR